MRKLLTFIFLASFIFTIGCGKPSGSILLNVDFDNDEDLTYRFVTSRDVVLELAGEGAEKSAKEQSTTEGLDMVITYKPLKTDIYGNTTVQAECKSISLTRKSFTSRSEIQDDPVGKLGGRTWTFTVNSAGQIQDYSSLEALVKELGAKAITDSGQRRIKGPDMIWDFVATQWFIWDAISSNNKMTAGVNPGQSWESLTSVPFAVRLPVERVVQYTIPTDQDITNPLITIDSTYTFRGYEEKDGKLVFDSKIPQMPSPYEGAFQTKGMFGFLRDYKADSLAGSGKAVYDLSKGVLISDRQEYKMDMTAGFMFPLGNTKPVLKVNQTITVELVE